MSYSKGLKYYEYKLYSGYKKTNTNNCFRSYFCFIKLKIDIVE